MTYATGTPVPPERTRLDIERELMKRGASQFGYNHDQGGRRSVVAFTLKGLQVHMTLTQPDPAEHRFTRTPTGKPRSTTAALDAYDQEVRRRWRALLLVVKAKLVAVDEGITTLEREFLADVVLANGRTVIEDVQPAIDHAKVAALEVTR